MAAAAAMTNRAAPTSRVHFTFEDYIQWPREVLRAGVDEYLDLMA